MTDFVASVEGWSERAKANMLNIARAAIQEVISDAQTPVSQGGSMPVDTSFLRNSLASGLNGSFGADAADSYVLTVAGMEIGDTVNVKWTAEYARARHYKPEDFGQGGGMWRDKAAARWQDQVNKAAGMFK